MIAREHRFRARSFLPLPRARVFAFFSDPSNLARITPPELGLEVAAPPPAEVRAGTVIEYRIRLLGLPVRWRARIARWDPPREFADEQLEGAFRTWIHTHRFAERDGGTEIEDDVVFTLRFPPLGELALPFVRGRLDRMFRHRDAALRRELGTKPAP